ncbi:MAG: LamG domain protein jellyroll fold domain protein, partial [Candidatus Doudnabacteria bacterium]|nr:LamG domain protein jellyroll fold domain protein [Candidatus Doudnabacteria bacterium]
MLFKIKKSSFLAPVFIWFAIITIILPLVSIFGKIVYPNEVFAAGNGFSYSRSITIDHTKVPNTDQTNFPVAFSGIFSYLATTGNGGKVQNANGYDVGFYSSSDCASGNKMNWETQIYSATGTGTSTYWIRIPTLSHTVDTVYYVCYGNSSISTDQSSRTSVWDSNFKAVYHSGDGTTISLNDSTVNANNLTNNGATETTGPLGAAFSFNGTTSYLERVGTAVTSAEPATLSALFFPNATTGYAMAIDGTGAGGGLDALGMRPAGVVRMTRGGSVTTNAPDSVSPNLYTISAWNHASAVFTSTSSRTIYVDGNSTGTTDTTAVTSPNSLNTTLVGARRFGNVINGVFNGAVAEARFSNIARSGDWATTEYNSMIGISSFYAIGSEQTTGVDTTPPVISGGSPSGALTSGTTSTTLAVTTDENATCKYSASSG